MKQLPTVEEHSVIKEFPSELSDEISCEDNVSPDKYLGIHYEWNESIEDKELKSGYFIGVCWIIKNESVLQVNPKIKNLDYLEIFLKCLSNPTVAKHFDDTYKIFFDEPLIEIDARHFKITPLLIVHFLLVLIQPCRRKQLYLFFLLL